MWSGGAHPSAAALRLIAAGAKNTPGSWETVSMAAVTMATARLHVKQWLSRDPAGMHPRAHTDAGRLSSRGKIICVDLGSHDLRQTAEAVLVPFLSTLIIKFYASQLQCNFTPFFFFTSALCSFPSHSFHPPIRPPLFPPPLSSGSGICLGCLVKAELHLVSPGRAARQVLLLLAARVFHRGPQNIWHFK